MPLLPTFTAAQATALLDTMAGAVGTMDGITATGTATMALATNHMSVWPLVARVTASAAMAASLAMAVLADTSVVVVVDTAAAGTVDAGPKFGGSTDNL